MNNIFKIMIIILFPFIFTSNIAYGCSYNIKEGKWINLTIGKSALNRISNYPYKIVQVVGDDSQFRVKYDDDGSSIYIMPLSHIGSVIDLSIKNDIGVTYDISFEVSDTKKSQSINLDSVCVNYKSDTESKIVSSMLRAMKDSKSDKFYVQDTNIDFTDNYYGLVQYKYQNAIYKKQISLTQTQLYKYKNIVGAVFKIYNRSKKSQDVYLNAFVRQFNNLLSIYPKLEALAKIEALMPKESRQILVIQKLDEVH